MKVDIDDGVAEEIARGELARLYMFEISNHFMQNQTLTKERFFELGKEATSKFKTELDRTI